MKRPFSLQVAELPTKNEISGADLKKLSNACDAFFKRRGLYIEPPLVRHRRLIQEKKDRESTDLSASYSSPESKE